MYFIQTSEKDAMTRGAELLGYQQRQGITSFARITDNRFLIVSDQLKIEAEDYFSYVYSNPTHGRTIILPRIVLSLKENQMIEPVLLKYPNELIVEETNGVKYILKCQLKNSEEVLEVVESIQKMEQQVE